MQEYIAQIKTFAKVSHWTQQHMALVAKEKLQGLALQFFNGNEEKLKGFMPVCDDKNGVNSPTSYRISTIIRKCRMRYRGKMRPQNYLATDVESYVTKL